ncbi:MAG: DUF4012 domain-containing protein [Actinomycetes bacterium]
MDILPPDLGPIPLDSPSNGVDRAPSIDLDALDAVMAQSTVRRRRKPPVNATPPDSTAVPANSSRSSSRRTSPNERRAVVAVAVVAGLLALTANAHPTGLRLPDLLLQFGFAFVVTLAAARARRVNWLILGALAALIASPGLWQVLGLCGLVLAIAATMLPRRRILGAVVAALCVPAMLHAPPFGFLGASALCVWIAVVPCLFSGYRVASRRSRQRMRTIGRVALVVAIGGTVIFGLSVWVAWSDLHSGVDEAQYGLVAMRDGHGSEAASRLASSADSLAAANGILGAWWTAPARLVPMVAQQANAMAILTDQGRRIAEAGALAASRADYRQLRSSHGQVNIEQVRQLQQPLDRVALTLGGARTDFAGANSPWLLGPVAAAVDQVSSEIDRTLPQAEVAAQGAAIAPAMLGGDETRHYFIAFTTPAEERGLGGFMGNWAELTASNGKLTLSKSGRTKDLNAIPAAKDRVITSPIDYVARYGRFDPGKYFQDVTASPDLPSVANVIGQLYPKMGGDQIDGVFVVDPFGLAALMNFTGPIEIAGSTEVLTADNAADILIRRQYVDFSSKQDRLDFLDEASRATFEKLTTDDLPSPEMLGSVLGPAVEARHVMFSAVRPDEEAWFTRIGATGAFPTAEADRDFFAVTSQNAGNNKIDVFLHREISYNVTYNPATGAEVAHATVKLTNDAPSSGLPDYVIGNRDQMLPTGTNRMYLSFYSPFALSTSRIDGVDVPFESQRELGFRVYSHYLSVPPGGTVTVELDLAGSLDSNRDYRLAVGMQPTVTPDAVRLTIVPEQGFVVGPTSGVHSDLDRQRATYVGQPGHGIEASVTFRRS